MDYMMSSKPIVHSVNAANDLVRESGCGITVEPDNPRLVLEAITRIAKLDKRERSELGMRGKDFVLRTHDYSVLAQKFIDFVSN
jgi:glycosyltransferase involved in cell wall biosynthesis